MHWAGFFGALLKVSIFIYLLLLLLLNFLLHSCSFACTGCIALKQQCILHTNTNTPTMTPTYGRVLSAIEKALQELVKEYQGVGRSLWDLVES